MIERAETMPYRVLTCALLLLPLAAQGSVLVPRDALGRDGRGLGPLAGATSPRRQQFLIGEGLLVALRGHGILRISFRRDGQPSSLASGKTIITVKLDQQTVQDPWRPSTTFQENLGPSAATVFQGEIVLPTSPRPAHRDSVGFGSSEAISIDLPQPYLYLGGTLCIDVEGEPVQGFATRAWPIDIDRDGARGVITTEGRSCVVTPERVTRSITADPVALRPGATARFVGFGAGGELAGLLLASQKLPSPIDLGFLGAPGCELGVVPILEMWSTATAHRRGPLAAANAYLSVPHAAQFVSARLHAQWLFVQGGAIRTTQTMTLDLAPVLASIDGAIVTSLPQRGASSGEIQVSAVPVVRIDWQ
ncbi:MAG: hypothetical protein R3F56_08385 [Planctomycetota bacterium]